MAPRDDLDNALEGWLTRAPAAPILTYYGPDGARVELSAATTANAVHKACNVFRDELFFDAGDVVWVDLPCHWQAPALILGAWAAGLTVAVGPPPADAAATVTSDAGRLPALGTGLAVSLHPLGMPLAAATPAGWEDFAALARAAPDRADLAWPDADQPWLLAPQPWQASGLRAQGEELARCWQLQRGSALVSTRPPVDLVGVLASTLVPALTAGRVVLVADDPARVAQISRQEGTDRTATDV